MSDRYVRVLGEVTDLDDVRVGVGVDYDSVTIGKHRFTAGQMEELAQLLVSAVWQAGQQKRQMDREAEPEVPKVTVGLACNHDTQVPEDEADCVLGYCPACQRLRPITKDALTALESGA